MSMCMSKFSCNFKRSPDSTLWKFSCNFKHVPDVALWKFLLILITHAHEVGQPQDRLLEVISSGRQVPHADKLSPFNFPKMIISLQRKPKEVYLKKQWLLTVLNLTRMRNMSKHCLYHNFALQDHQCPFNQWKERPSCDQSIDGRTDIPFLHELLQLQLRAWAIEMHMENSADQNRGPHFVWACAVDMHLDMSQEPFCVKIYRKNAGAQRSYPYLTQTWTLTVGTPQFGHCFGEKALKNKNKKNTNISKSSGAVGLFG